MFNHVGIIEIFAVIVFFLSFYGLITSKNIIKSIASIGIMEIAVIMFFLGIGFFDGMKPPIGANLENAADPLPQALVITTIIIGITICAVNLSMLITLCRQHKAADWDVVEKKSSE
ncbi:MAG: NADH-quinone oxidoreductase subunit K [Lachnospiraceae bacterium]|nr:NADH-quinone oxidoreductase subunit K [Lachnospiraceae bacterium]